MKNGTGEFKGSTRQALLDITARMDRIESKLDKVIERNILMASFISLVIGLAGFFIKK